jgi:metal-dependent hydrolase (beta-lactamase superfamily II)
MLPNDQRDDSGARCPECGRLMALGQIGPQMVLALARPLVTFNDCDRTSGPPADDFEHEIGTNFVVKGNGLVVLTSGSHRGVINTIRQAQAASGVQKVHAVIGGFHIVPPLDDNYIRQVVATFKEINPDYLIPGHCSGERFYDLACNELGDKVIHSAVGTRFVFGA